MKLVDISLCYLACFLGFTGLFGLFLVVFLSVSSLSRFCYVYLVLIKSLALSGTRLEHVLASV